MKVRSGSTALFLLSLRGGADEGQMALTTWVDVSGQSDIERMAWTAGKSVPY
jgi:hypothetical protein